jgi:hypothetical protein
MYTNSETRFKLDVCAGKVCEMGLE